MRNKINRYTRVAAIVFLLIDCGGCHYRSSAYTYSIPRQLDDGIRISSLGANGMDTGRIVSLTKLILEDNFPNIHSLLIIRDNRLIYENYFGGRDESATTGKKGYTDHNIDDPHDCRSISKTFTAACVGIAVKQGLIKNIDQPIFSWFPKYATYFDSTKRKITIRHLLTMTSGLEWDEKITYADPKNCEIQMDRSADPIGFILSRPMAAEPGTQFNYNGGNPQLLEEILLKVTGQKLDKYAEQYLFTPLGFGKHEWAYMNGGMPAAAWGLRLRSRDLAKFGLLYMNNGNWDNIQIVDSDWVQKSVSPQVSRSENKKIVSDDGYGFLLWTYTLRDSGVPLEITEANGNGGQIIFMCKRLHLLIVFTGGNYDRRDIINNYFTAIKDYVLPALRSYRVKKNTEG